MEEYVFYSRLAITCLNMFLFMGVYLLGRDANGFQTWLSWVVASLVAGALYLLSEMLVDYEYGGAAWLVLVIPACIATSVIATKIRDERETEKKRLIDSYKRDIKQKEEIIEYLKQLKKADIDIEELERERDKWRDECIKYFLKD